MFLAKGHLPEFHVGRYDKGDDEMISGAAHRSPEICFMAGENPGKPWLKDRLMKATILRHKWGPFPPNKVGRIAHQVKEEEGRKEGKDTIDINKYVI